MREEFEKLPQIAKYIDRVKYSETSNFYYGDDPFISASIDGAWYAYQEQQKKLDCCREENKALLNRLAIYEKHVKAIKNIHETQFDEQTDTSFILGNLDGFIEYLENDLKGSAP